MPGYKVVATVTMFVEASDSMAATVVATKRISGPPLVGITFHGLDLHSAPVIPEKNPTPGPWRHADPHFDSEGRCVCTCEECGVNDCTCESGCSGRIGHDHD